MSTGVSIRPVQTSSFVPVRAEPAAERQVARTELPEAQTVAAVPDSQPVQNDVKDQRKLSNDINRFIDDRSQSTKTVDRDEATQELVFRTIRPETGQVVVQYPDVAVLRQRAYILQQQRDAELLKSETEPKASNEAVKSTA